ncbi:hypothetical protein CWI38_0021p0050 [Hamiltosporidium tvaerminnensis]|uniref:Uncharacterized protein n=2 Tax=Hamiltosporidium TaxID=1176354 RepID=A0A4Q9LGG8_9MICR|nr:hypothetical protein LUQ84_000481 [Hamiltosporidium tvaerminnensis]TBU05142.1 hypothetical protein CWI37_0045p0090 [Hamiltosporidium tvaerminnensis]TBU07173.1 hypothetical protein CWI36_0315p0040 [Hamiltosporidium magnivora]TBU09908.1 hypothetical protein CWI39_0020p0080 [Hamiltosporidium magnivora]TBU20799.1 hypothetical protein CWI38_0021p0050 [Hamiltosporidium tvaerminnensis]
MFRFIFCLHFINCFLGNFFEDTNFLKSDYNLPNSNKNIDLSNIAGNVSSSGSSGGDEQNENYNNSTQPDTINDDSNNTLEDLNANEKSDKTNEMAKNNGDEEKYNFNWKPRVRKVVIPGEPKRICIVKVIPVPVDKYGNIWKP